MLTEQREKTCRVKRKLMRFCSERKRGPVKSQVKGVETKSEEVQVLLLRASVQLGSPN